jgi:hypothetical protein
MANVVSQARTFNRTHAHCVIGTPTIAWMLSAVKNDKSFD